MFLSRREQESQKKFPGLGTGCLLTLLLLTLYLLSRPDVSLFSLSFIDLTELKTLDYRFRVRGKQTPSPTVVIVAIDEKTLDNLDSWQAKRRMWMAELVDKLAQQGAKVIGFDVNFAEPDHNPGLEVIRRLREHLRDEEGVSGNTLKPFLDRLENQVNYDIHLADSLRKAGNVVLGMFFFRSQKEGIEHIPPEHFQGKIDLISRMSYNLIKFPPGIPSEPLKVYKMIGMETNLPELSEATRSVGHFNIFPDPDGVFRRVPLLLAYEGNYYPSLNMEVVRLYLNSPQPVIYGDKFGIVSKIQLGSITIPCDEQGRLLVNYYGPAKTFPHYSMSDVLNGMIPPSTFKDKIVLVGSTATGIHDLRTTPFETSENYPGVEIHANVIENILQKNFLTRPDWLNLADGFMILIMGFFSSLLFSKLRPLASMITFPILLTLLAGAIYYAFASKNLWLNFTFPGIVTVLSFVGVTGQKYLVEEREKKKIKGAFEHYVPPELINEIMKHPEKLNLGGERKVLTVLFSDIRGFTSISEGMESQDLVEFLNEYLTAMTNIVFKHQGTLDKYIGDAVMAFYGAPFEQKDHALRACLTAIDMLEELKKLQIQWETRKLPILNIGIGIHTGEMAVGNMGSEKRFSYTVLGDAVNLASRLEGVNKYYGTNIILSADSYRHVREHLIGRQLDMIRVKGKKEPIVIYELLGRLDIQPKVHDKLELFRNGVEAYRYRKWSEALDYFQKVLQFDPLDTPASIYIKRCQAYLINPPPPDWDRVYELESK